MMTILESFDKYLIFSLEQENYIFKIIFFKSRDVVVGGWILTKIKIFYDAFFYALFYVVFSHSRETKNMQDSYGRKDWIENDNSLNSRHIDGR